MKEEKEIIFKIIKNDDYIKVISNIEEGIENISNQEIMVLITELTSFGMRNLFKELKSIQDVDIETMEDEELEKFSDKLDDKIMDFTGGLIHFLINLIFNYKKIVSGGRQDLYDYSLAVYTTDKDRKAGDVFTTFHYGNVEEKDKILGTYYFYKDAVKKMLESNISKEKVKFMIDKSLTFINYKLNNYIDKY